MVERCRTVATGRREADTVSRSPSTVDRSPFRPGRSVCVRLLVLLVCLVLCACGSPGLPTSADRPPIVLISLDTCRADLFGVMTGEVPSLTPRLDAFARQAVLFDHAFAQIPHTLASHMSMMTSLYPEAHDVRTELDVLPDGIPTLPQILDRAGYWTVGVVTSDWLEPQYGFGRGFDVYGELASEQADAEGVTREALSQWKRGTGPRFLFAHYYDLHSDFAPESGGNHLPYDSPPGDRAWLGVGANGDEFCTRSGECNTRYLMALNRGDLQVAPAQVRLLHGLYRANMPSLDAQVGALFDGLERLGAYDDALIIVTADHGEEFHEHGRFIHSQPYDESIHVPLFVKLPHGRAAGRRVEDLVETVDLLPTVLDLLQIDPPATVQGRSLLGLILGGGAHDKHIALAEDSEQATRFALRTADAKLIEDVVSGHRELYDLVQDPGELHDVSAERPGVVEEMERQLEDLLRVSRELSRRFGPSRRLERGRLTPEERKRLESLGYLN